MKTLSRLTIALILLCGFGCKTIEGRMVEVELKSTPPAATAYLIPWEKWAAKKGEERLEAYRAARQDGSPDAAERLRALEATFSKYRRDEGLTPFKAKARNYEHCYLAVHGSEVGRGRFTPRQDLSKELTLQ